MSSDDIRSETSSLQSTGTDNKEGSKRCRKAALLRRINRRRCSDGSIEQNIKKEKVKAEKKGGSLNDGIMKGRRRSKTSSTATVGGSKNRKLEKQAWYHGVRTREDISGLLEKTGDYLVRGCQNADKYSIVLNVMGAKDVDNFTISVVDGSYTLRNLVEKGEQCPKFPDVISLIEYYNKHRLPNDRRLKRAIHRPNWLIPHDAVNYDPNDELGSGHFCSVYKGTLNRSSSMDVAIKICHPPKSELSARESLEARMNMINEAKIMSAYSHENVITFYGMACDHPPIMILMEYCAGGSLDSHLIKRGSKIESTEKTVYCLEAARGMHYLHTQKCLHRDLAARNCLISKDGLIKIADFGLSKILKEGILCKEVIKQAPLRWMAPECIRKVPEFSTKSDVWSFGALVFEIFSNGCKPFANEENDLKILRAIKHARMEEPPDGTTPQIADLLKRIWQKDPNERPEFSTIVDDIVTWLSMETPIIVANLIINELSKVHRIKEVNLEKIIVTPPTTMPSASPSSSQPSPSPSQPSQPSPSIPSPSEPSPSPG